MVNINSLGPLWDKGSKTVSISHCVFLFFPIIRKFMEKRRPSQLRPSFSEAIPCENQCPCAKLTRVAKSRMVGPWPCSKCSKTVEVDVYVKS